MVNSSRLKHVAIVAPQFPPCNLAAVHRARYFVMHLEKFGWKPTVITVDPIYYEDKTDPELSALLPENLALIRTKAFPVRPVKIIGDIGIRALWWHYQALCNLAKKQKIDVLYIPIPPHYSALLGELLFRRFGIPYAIDYIDPWVMPWPASSVFLSKAWLAYQLGKILEPIALRNVSLITGVAPNYYKDVYRRYPWLRDIPSLGVPYGAEEGDFEYLQKHPRSPYLFDPSDGNMHITYAGAMLPNAYATLEIVCQALKDLQNKNPDFFSRIRIHFIGTGKSSGDTQGFNVLPFVKRFELGTAIVEHPARIPFLDVLNHLTHSAAVLILGSTDSHYSPSKIFQGVLARRPLVAILHDQSSACKVLQDSRGGAVIRFSEHKPLPECADEIGKAIIEALTIPYDERLIDWSVFSRYSAESCTKELAAAFDKVIEPKIGINHVV